MLASEPPTVASGPLSAKLSPWLKFLVTPLQPAQDEGSEHIQAQENLCSP